MKYSIREGEIHLWTVFTDDINEPGRLDRDRRLLSPAELERQGRFHFERDRHLFLVSHALVRLALSHYADIEPSQWRFAENAYGKPEISNANIGLPLRFNLTHTAGLAACAICLECDIGVDVENLDKRVDLGVADSYFAPPEVQHLNQVPPDLRKDAFFEFWTLKESYIKARGMGLSLPLGDFSFQLGDDQGPRISFTGGIQDRPEQWQFFQLKPGDSHQLAIAVQGSQQRQWTIVRHSLEQA